MKHPILLALLLALPGLAFNQTANTHRNQFALSVSPTISYFYGTHANDFGAQQPRLGFRIQADFERKLTDRLWLRAGLGYALNQYRTKLDGSKLQWPNQNNGNGGYDPTRPGENPGYLDRRDKILSLPVGLRYFWTNRFYSDVDLSANAVVSESPAVYRAGFGAAIGYQVPLGANMYLFMQPAFHFILNNAFSGSLKEYNLHPYSFGLEVGVRGF
jgi:hypothetical protein